MATEAQKRKETTESQRAQVITLREEGYSYVKIAERTGVKRSTCFDIVKRDKERREPGNPTPYTASAPRSGRPEKLNRRERRHLIYLTKRSRRISLGILCRSITVRVSMKTARKYLKDAGLQRRRAKRKPWLTKLQKFKRLMWCKERRNWTIKDWRDIIWTDESRFEVGHVAGVVWVWRNIGEQDKARCLQPTFKSGRTSVMIWGCMMYGQKGPIVILPESSMNGPNYVKWILEPHLKPFYEKARKESDSGDIEVMEDNAPCHTAKFSTAARNRLLIPKIPWPPQSPDLNPIENLWRIIKNRINQRDPPIRSKLDLQKALQEEWDRLTPADFDHLIISMQKRVAECIKARGGSTHY